MSLFSQLRHSTLAIAPIAALAVVAGLHLGAATPAPPQLKLVSVDAAEDRQVSLVTEVRSREDASPKFSVTTGDVPVRPTVVPLIPDQAALAVVVDASAGTSAWHEGSAGAANLLLQLPPASRTLVVADTKPPKVLAPVQTGAPEALRALSSERPQGERATAEALTLAAQQLPPISNGRRVIVLYTVGRDAGGLSVADLVRRLAAADAVLAVVSRGSDMRYWSRVALATGGVLVAPGPSSVMSAFDEVMASLRARYVLSFPTPQELPSRVSVRVSTADGTQTAQAVVSPGQVGGTDPPGAAFEEGGGMFTWIWFVVLGAAALLAIVGVVMLTSARRSQPPASLDAKVTYQRLEGILGGSKVPHVTAGVEAMEPSQERAQEPAPEPAQERPPELSGEPEPERAPPGDAVEPSRSEAAPVEPQPEHVEAQPVAPPVTGRPAAAQPAAAQPAAVQPATNANSDARRPSVVAAVEAAQQRARAVAAAARTARTAAEATSARRPAASGKTGSSGSDRNE
jgi:hypothetical protein